MKGFCMKKIESFVLRTCVCGVFILCIAQIVGCFSFQSDSIMYYVFSCELLLCAILIEESCVIEDDEKNLLLGVLFGSMMFASDFKAYYLFLYFIINTIWIKKTQGINNWEVIYGLLKIVVIGVATLEIYNICSMFNMHALNNKSMMMFFSDKIECILLGVVLLLCICRKRKRDGFIKEIELDERLCQAKFLVWYVLIGFTIITFICIACNSAVNKTTIDRIYVGKSMDRGYLYVEDEKRIYYVNKLPIEAEEVGTVIDYPDTYAYYDTENGLLIQKTIVHMVRILCMLFYGDKAIIVMVLGLLMLMINNEKIIKRDRKNRIVKKGTN